MHEASLMKGLMYRIQEIAAQESAVRVTGISVWLGALSHMSQQHFTEHFEQAAAGGIAEGANLTIEESHDANHPQAQDILLKSVEIEN